MANLRKLTKFATMAGIATALGATAAHADVETFTGYYPGPALTDQVSTDWNGSSPYEISVPTFNKSLGTLTSVQLSFEGDVSSSGSINNTATGAGKTASVSHIVISTYLFLMPAGYTFSALDTTLAAIQNDAGSDALVISNPQIYSHLGTITILPDSSSAFPSATNKTDLETTTINGGLSSYETIGIGDLLFPIVTQTSLDSSVSGGNVVLSQDTLAGAELTVKYTYTPTTTPAPEPATLAVLGVGLAGLGLTRFRRR